MIDLVPYRPAHAPALVALWNAATEGRYPIMPALWEANTAGDPSFRPQDVVVAEHAGEVAGLCLAKRYRGDHPGNAVYHGLGFVGLLAVRADLRGQGLGSRLLAEAERRHQAEGGTRMRLGGGYGHFFPGVPEPLAGSMPFFERRGYQPDQSVWDVRANLAGLTLPDVAMSEGFTLRPYRSDEADALVAFLDATFPGRWPADTVDWLAVGRPPVLTVGVFAEGRPHGFCHLHPPGSFGALRWAGFNPSMAALGPIGVDKSVRGQGLGLALLVAGLEALRRLGATDTVIDWTTLLDFYGRCGFSPWIRYQLARKDLA